MGHKGYLYGGVLPGEGLDPGGKALAQIADGLTPVEGGEFDDRPEFVHQGQGHTIINEGDYPVGLNLDCVVGIGYAHGKGDRFDGGFQPPAGGPIGLPLEFQLIEIVTEDKVPRIDPHRTQFPRPVVEKGPHDARQNQDATLFLRGFASLSARTET